MLMLQKLKQYHSHAEFTLGDWLFFFLTQICFFKNFYIHYTASSNCIYSSLLHSCIRYLIRDFYSTIPTCRGNFRLISISGKKIGNFPELNHIQGHHTQKLIFSNCTSQSSTRYYKGYALTLRYTSLATEYFNAAFVQSLVTGNTGIYVKKNFLKCM